MSEQVCDLSNRGTHDGASALQLPLATCDNHMSMCVIYVLPSHSTPAHAFSNKRALNQRNFVARTLVKQREKKNSRTVLKYRQFLRKINTATNGRLYHCENKPFSGSLVYLVCILVFTETVLKSLKNTFYNVRFVQAIPHADKCSYL